MRKSLVLLAGFLLGAFFCGLLWPSLRSVAAQNIPSEVASAQNYPPDLKNDIEWTGAGDTVAVVQSQFNLARGKENAQLNTLVQPLTMPTQAQWDAKDEGQKALWLINQERTARGLLPLDNVESNVTQVAQAWAEWLLANNAWGHEADGRDPKQRLDANANIAACHDFLGVAENLSVSMSDYPTPNKIAVEQAIYSWMYEDAEHSWLHRHAILWTPYTDNSGTTGKEGFIGLGHARGAYTFPTDPKQIRWSNTDMIVLNLFDPCATWTYAAPPSVATPPDPEPVTPVEPEPDKVSVSGQTRLPTWVTIVSQPFESNTWPGNWEIADSTGTTDGEYYWSLSTCQLDADGGASSGSPVTGGANGSALTTCSASYPNNARSWMIYGPFSLADAVEAEMRVKVWVDTEVSVDMLCMAASTDKKRFNGPCVSGRSSQDGAAGWVEELFDLNHVYQMGSMLGKNSVYVTLAFITDESITKPNLGVFADNLIVRKGVIGAGAAGVDGVLDASAASPLAGVRITDERGNWALTDADGGFTLANLSRGTHTLTPTKSGFQFYPPTLTVDLSAGDVSSVSFVGSSSIHEQLYLPQMLGRASGSAASAGLTAEDASFELVCDEEGCSLLGPLVEVANP
jgi:uncharacterized protein YkwD